jgi:hypothetical protein
MVYACSRRRTIPAAAQDTGQTLQRSGRNHRTKPLNLHGMDPESVDGQKDGSPDD